MHARVLLLLLSMLLALIAVAEPTRVAVFGAAGPGAPDAELLAELDRVVRRELVIGLDPDRFFTLMAAAAAPGCTGRCAVRQAAEYGAALAVAVRLESDQRPMRVDLTVYAAPDGATVAARRAEATARSVLLGVVAEATAELAAALSGTAPPRLAGPLTDPAAEQRAAAAALERLAAAAGENSIGSVMRLVTPGLPFTPPPPGQEYIQARPLPAPMRPYLLASTEVTVAQWRALMGERPDMDGGDRRPASQVTWFDAIEFCNRLSEQEGMTPAYVLDEGAARWREEADGYRLPTDAEWGYACRAGSLTMFAAGARRDDLARTAWFTDNAGGRARDVGRRDANAWGFHDMHGNVWEWIWDAYATLPDLSPDNIEQPGAGPDRTIRGGSWYSPAIACRTTNFCRIDPAFASGDLGFRIARTP